MVRCNVEGCQNHAYYGEPGGKPCKCGSHKEDGMINLIDKRMCICNPPKRSSYGFQDDKKPTRCSKCKEEGMVDIANLKCKCGTHKPTFGFPDDKNATRCSKCKEEGMVDIINGKCNCGNHRPSFGFPDDKNPTRCSKCKEKGMVNIVSGKCKCGNHQPSFGFPNDKTATRCSECKEDGMVDIVSLKCKGSGCLGNRILGTQGNPKYEGYCVSCFVHDFPKDPRALTARKNSHELKVRDYLIENLPEFDFIHNTTLFTGNCDCNHARRIDFRVLINGTLLCIEVDENEHKYYDKENEEARPNDLMMVHTGKFLFIRFNPHPYTFNGIRENPSITERLENLVQVIRSQVDRIQTEEWEAREELIDEIKLYFSN